MEMPPAERVESVRAAAEAVAPRVIELTAEIAAIPAPTGDELARTRYATAQFTDLGLRDVAADELGDVVGYVPGSGSGKQLVVSAHIDTVFPRETDLSIRREPQRLWGPGIGDNSLGVAALLGLPLVLEQAGLAPAVDVVLVANVGEEGLGNLRGIRAVMDRLQHVGAVIVLEGHTLGRVTHTAVGSRRYRIRVSGPGGHSWGDYGRPSAIHVLATLIDQLAAIPLPTQPKTTLNVGLIEGGISVNTIAAEASCVVDLRSTDMRELKRLAHHLEHLVKGARRGGVSTELELLGERPAGSAPTNCNVVQTAMSALRALGIEPVCDASSTDANIAISRGIPAVCIGITTGAHAHRLDEYIDLAPIPMGLSQLTLTVLGAADQLANGHRPA